MLSSQSNRIHQQIPDDGQQKRDQRTGDGDSGVHRPLEDLVDHFLLGDVAGERIADLQVIRDALTGHVAKEEVIYEIFKRAMNTGVAITGALIALLLSIIGYLLVNPTNLP